tara:strand:- start:362 stop:538 length:177 start_codon:yes stop_codon:yes gene_type:complete
MALTKEEKKLIDVQIKAYQNMIKHMRGMIKGLRAQRKGLRSGNVQIVVGAPDGTSKLI